MWLLRNFRERIFHPEDLERLRDQRKAALARGLPFEVEHRALRKRRSVSLVPYSLQAFPKRGRAGDSLVRDGYRH